MHLVMVLVISTAGLGLINYQGGETAAYNIFLSTGILLLMFTISTVMLLFAENKASITKTNQKVKKNR